MSHPSRKRKRTVPKSIVEKSDHDAMEAIFGKRVMREVDKIAPPPKPEKSKDSEDIGTV